MDTKPVPPASTISRRRFLAAVTAPLVLPSGVLGQPGRPGANDRVVTGHIGVGARGRLLLQRLRANAAAVCDVDTRRLREGAAVVGPGVRLFNDYRNLLEERDIDAVVITTPDHWHALQAIHACEAGKDVFLEMPAVRLPEEARELLRAATWFARVVHCPPPAPQPDAVAAAGGLTRIRAWAPANPAASAATGTEPPPEELDWDRWLGPARYRPFRRDWDWRRVRDLGGGEVRQTGAPLFTAAMDARGGFPGGDVTVRAETTSPPPGPWDCPGTMSALFQFTDGLELAWSQPGDPNCSAPSGVARDPQSADAGQESVAGLAAPDTAGPQAALETWLDAVRARDGETAGLDTALRAGVLGTLANVAALTGRGFTWDPAAGTVSGDEQARRMLAFTGRGEYTL